MSICNLIRKMRCHKSHGIRMCRYVRHDREWDGHRLSRYGHVHPNRLYLKIGVTVGILMESTKEQALMPLFVKVIKGHRECMAIGV